MTHGDILSNLDPAWIGQVFEGNTNPLWWLSFADPDIAATIPVEEQKPGGPSFLGATVIQAADFVTAVRLSWLLGVNPGGEVQSWGPIPPEVIGPEWRNRLLSKAEIDDMPEPVALGA